MGKGAKNGAVTASDLFRTVVDVLDNGILLVDGKGTVLAGNPSAKRILGFETDRVSIAGDDTPWSFTDADGAPVEVEDLPCQRSIRTGVEEVGVVLGVTRKDGSFAWVEFDARPTVMGDERVAVLSFCDITGLRAVGLRELAGRDTTGAGAALASADSASGPSHSPPASSPLQVFERLSEASQGASLEDIVAAARELLDMDVAYFTHHTDTEQVFESIAGDGDSFGIHAETRMPLDETYCQRILSGDLPNLVPDLTAIPNGGIGAYVSVPIVLADGRLHGTLCCASHDARGDLSARDVCYLKLLAVLVGDQIERAGSITPGVESAAAATGSGALIGAVEAHDHYTSRRSEALL